MKPSQDKERKYTLYNVSANQFKDSFFSYIKHASKKFFSEIMGERIVEIKNKTSNQVGRLYKRKNGVRNEALDCRVYAMARLEILNYDLIRI